MIGVLAEQSDGRAALSALCEEVRELLPCDRVQIWRGDLRQMTMGTVVAVGYSPDDAARLEELVAPMPSARLMPEGLASGDVIFVPDSAANPDPFAGIAFRDFGIAAAAVILLERAGRVLGALQLSWCAAADAFVPPRDVVDAIRHHLSVALDFLARTDDAVRLSETLSQTAIVLGSIHDPEALLEATAAKMAEAVGCDWAAVHFLEDDGETIFRAGQHGLPIKYEPMVRVRLEPGTLASAFAGMQDGVIEFPDATIHPETRALHPDVEVSSFFSVPLVQESALVGFLTLGYLKRTGRFSRRQVSLAKGLSHHVLAALRNARTMQSLREVNRVKSDFIAAVSHDLRTPLHVLIGYSDMLLDRGTGTLNPEQADLAERLRESTLRFRELVDDIVEVARLEAAHDALSARPVSLAKLIDELCREVEPLRPPDVELRCRAEDTTVVCDGPKVKTIVRNLLSNALKFTRAGVVEVSIERPVAEEIRVRVRDTGPGIGPQDRPHLFEMFQQGDAGKRSGGSGLGLGLYLVKRIADMLGGGVRLVSSEPGQTVFEVWLPVRSVPDPPDAPP